MTADSEPDDETPWPQRSPVAFGVVMLAVLYGLKILAIPLMLAVGGTNTADPIREGGPLLLLVSFLILPLETFLGQLFPLWFLWEIGVRGVFALCAWSGAFFGVLHLVSGPSGRIVGFLSGTIFSFCWLCWRSLSVGAAFWYTTAVHAAHNLLALLCLGVGR